MADSYYKTKIGLITRIYNNQIRHSKDRGHRKPEYSKDELKDWLMSQESFHILFSEYKNSGFKKRLAPSVNRKNNDIHYYMNNIELMTWFDNNQLGRKDRELGNDGVGKPVLQILNGDIIAEYPTITASAKALGKKRATAINEVLAGRSKTAYGFVWKYKE